MNTENLFVQPMPLTIDETKQKTIMNTENVFKDFKKSPFYFSLRWFFCDHKPESIDDAFEMVKRFDEYGVRVSTLCASTILQNTEHQLPEGFIITEYFNGDENLMKLFLEENLVESCEVEVTEYDWEPSDGSEIEAEHDLDIVRVSDLQDEGLEPNSNEYDYDGDLISVDPGMVRVELEIGSVFLTLSEVVQ